MQNHSNWIIQKRLNLYNCSRSWEYWNSWCWRTREIWAPALLPGLLFRRLSYQAPSCTEQQNGVLDFKNKVLFGSSWNHKFKPCTFFVKTKCSKLSVSLWSCNISSWSTSWRLLKPFDVWAFVIYGMATWGIRNKTIFMETSWGICPWNWTIRDKRSFGRRFSGRNFGFAKGGWLTFLSIANLAYNECTTWYTKLQKFSLNNVAY